MEWAECLREVVHFSLLSVSANSNSIFMHRLVQATVRQLYAIDDELTLQLVYLHCCASILSFVDSVWPVSHRRQVLIHASAFLSLPLRGGSQDVAFDDKSTSSFCFKVRLNVVCMS